jgi:hypothetical protein
MCRGESIGVYVRARQCELVVMSNPFPAFGSPLLMARTRLVVLIVLHTLISMNHKTLNPQSISGAWAYTIWRGAKEEVLISDSCDCKIDHVTSAIAMHLCGVACNIGETTNFIFAVGGPHPQFLLRCFIYNSCLSPPSHSLTSSVFPTHLSLNVCAH